LSCAAKSRDKVTIEDFKAGSHKIDERESYGDKKSKSNRSDKKIRSKRDITIS
jgi:hypothetical protein